MGKGVDMSTRRVVAILGAGGALGGAISARLASEADTDLVLSDMSEDSLGSTLGALAGAAGSVETMVADVTDIPAFTALIKARPAFHILVNNAGTNRPRPLAEIEPEDYDLILGLNLRAAIFVLQAVTQRIEKASGSPSPKNGRRAVLTSAWGKSGVSAA